MKLRVLGIAAILFAASISSTPAAGTSSRPALAEPSLALARAATESWPSNWVAQLHRRASALRQTLPVEEQLPSLRGSLALVPGDWSNSRMDSFGIAAEAHLAARETGSLMDLTHTELASLRARGIDPIIYERPYRVGHMLFEFIAGVERVAFPAALAGSSATPEGRSLRLVQLDGPPTPGMLKKIESGGARILSPFPGFAYLVWANDAELDAAKRATSVRWTVPFESGFRVSQEIAATILMPEITPMPEGEIRVLVSAILADGENTRIYNALQATGATITQRATMDIYENAVVTLPASRLAALLSEPGLLFVEPYFPRESEDETASQIVAGNLNVSNQPVTGYRTWLTTRGIDGTGVTIGIVDGGINASHQDFTGRVTAIDYGGGTIPTGSSNPHGHHVAGIAAGNPPNIASSLDPNGFFWGQGMAPAASLINQAAIRSGASSTTDQLVRDLVTGIGTNGVTGYVQNNSWGNGAGSAPGANASYQTNERNYDLVVRDGDSTVGGNQSAVICFSAGNEGQRHGCPSQAQTLTRPKVAKNVIVTGAANNFRTSLPSGQDVLQVDNIADLAPFSSRGPAQDGRIKPDVVSPGAYIVSARTASWNPGFGVVDTNYLYCSGTSMASPATTGAAALLVDWWQDNNSGARPSPAMVRNLLITSTVDMNSAGDTISGCATYETTTAPIPNKEEGWGLLRLNNILQSPVPVQMRDQLDRFISPGETLTFDTTVSSSTDPLLVTVSWTDDAGAIGANPALVNDLDLQVIAGGNTYLGSVLVGGVSTTGGTRNTVDNVERVILPAGINGPVRIIVRAAVLAGDGVPSNADFLDQDFALVVKNATAITPVLAPFYGEGGVQTLNDAGGNGNNDGLPDPGETGITLTTPVLNGGNGNGTNITGTLVSLTPTVTVTQATSSYLNMLPGDNWTNSIPFEIAVSPSHPCGTPLDFRIDVASTESNSSFNFSIPCGTLTASPGGPILFDVSPGTAYGSSPTSVQVPFTVTQSGLVTDVDVFINLTHPWVSDNRVQVISPQGTIVTVFDNIGGSGDNITDVWFDDSATAGIFSVPAPFGPATLQPLNFLAAFNGQTAAGNWSVLVTDTFPSSDNGVLNRVQLRLTTGSFVCNPPPGAAVNDWEAH